MTCLEKKTLYSLPGGNSRYPGRGLEAPPHILSNQAGGYGFDNCPYLNQKKQPSKPLDNDARDE